MKSRYYLLGGFLLAVLTLVVVRNRISSPAGAALAAQPNGRSASDTAAVSPVRPEPTTQPASISAQTTAPVAMPREVTDLSDVKRIAKRLQIKLSPEELAGAHEAYTAIVEARQLVESRNARVKVVDAKHYIIEIPPYDAQGQQLRAQLGTDFAKVMGSEKAQRFMAESETMISDRNNNWGKEGQIIDVSYNAEAGIYEIRHGRGLAATQEMGAPIMVSNSQLTPANLSKYTYLRSVFPNPTK